jgi:hypothetical protein
MIDLSTLHGPGFGCQTEKIKRELPIPAVALER